MKQYTVGFIIGLVAVAAFIYWKKPTCKPGYIPIHGLFDGWSCMPGYKP